MTDITSFLAARLDEDEAVARAARQSAPGGSELAQQAGPCVDEAGYAHIARHDPARVLREVEAGRKLIAEYEGAAAITGGDDQYAAGVWTGLRALAARFSDHPDFQQEWKL